MPPPKRRGLGLVCIAIHIFPDLSAHDTILYQDIPFVGEGKGRGVPSRHRI
jgi:hypothetical protein